MKYIIGITGKKKSGKDEVCKCLFDIYKNKVQRIGFADALKEEVSKGCGVPVEYIELHKDVFRSALQWWGTDFRRNLFRTDYWIIELKKRVKQCPAELIVIPDVRFVNEAKALVEELGATIIKVVRPNASSTIDMHQSETEMDEIQYDVIINNDKSLKELRSKTVEAIKQLNSYVYTTE